MADRRQLSRDEVFQNVEDILWCFKSKHEHIWTMPRDGAQSLLTLRARREYAEAWFRPKRLLEAIKEQGVRLGKHERNGRRLSEVDLGREVHEQLPDSRAKPSRGEFEI
jgi:hypothetical protein